jgi:hypothetical protein
LVPFGFQGVLAQEAPAPEVARISLVQGDVSALRGDAKDWIVATANAPLARGDTIATGQGSRTEVQLDFADILRLDEGSQAFFADLTRSHIQIQVASGLVSFAILPGAEADVEIDTPNMAIHLLGEGDYRLLVSSADYAQLAVSRGGAQVFAGRGSMRVSAGQTIEVKGTADPDYQLTQAAARDGWDRWNDERDRTIADAQSWKYVNRYYTGAQDLDRYGDWVQVPGYGWCWTPYADAGWVPYRNGRWVSDRDYEWMWVGYEPWGWAPYHYGRWISYDGDWSWWPGLGTNGTRPIWAPGYVAFIGLGGRPAEAGTGLEFDSIGWCPLGPHDPFEPWWGAGRSLHTIDMASLNAAPANSTEQVAGSNLQGLLTNPDLRGAVTTVSTQNFANGRIGHDLYPVNESILEQGSFIQGPLPVTPGNSSLQPVDRPVNRAALPAATLTNRHFVTRSPVPAARGSDSVAQIGPLASGQHPEDKVPPQSGSAAPTPGQGVAGPRESATVGTQAEGPKTQPPGPHEGWRRFTWGSQISRSPADAGRRNAEAGQQPVPAPQQAPQSTLQPTPQGQGNGEGWRHFSPPPKSANPGRDVTTQDQQGWKHFNAPPGGKSAAPQGSEYRI